MFDSMYASWAAAIGPWVLPLALLGIVATPVGLAGLVWVGRRSFNRRNFAGVEEFSSYGDAISKTLVEGLVRVAGTLFFVVGALSLFFAGYGLFLQRYR